jgi:hypothetical protein
MARVTFVRTHRYYPRWPSKAVYIEYLAGQTYDNVRRECADQAIAEGAGIENRTTRRRRRTEAE